MLPRLQADRELVKRFFREAKILSGLSHPNIVTLIDFGTTDDGSLFLVTEFLAGNTLDKCVPEGLGLKPDDVVEVMRQICDGVGEAHRNRLVHRDLKPSNIFISPRPASCSGLLATSLPSSS
jgi:serine/threonine-protein kinase